MDAAQLRPLAVGEILDLAINVYRERFAHLVKATAAVIAPVAVFRALVQLSILPDEDSPLFSGPVDSTGQPTIEAGEVWSLLAGLALLGIVSMISSQLATAASFKLVSGAYLDEPPDWRASLRFATTRLGSLVWLAIVFGLAVGVGLLFCLVPGVYLYVAFSVAVPALLLEDLRGSRALGRSRGLVKQRWWPTVGVLLVAFFLSAVVQGVVSGLLVLVVSVGDNDLVAAVAQAIADTVGTALTTPFTAAVVAVVYFDLRVRKEGFDLELLARRVGVEPPPGGWPVAPAGGWTPPPPPAVGGWTPPPGPGGAGGAPPTWPPGPGPAAGDPANRPPYWPPPPDWRPAPPPADDPGDRPPPSWSAPAPPPAGDPEDPDRPDRPDGPEDADDHPPYWPPPPGWRPRDGGS